MYRLVQDGTDVVIDRAVLDDDDGKSYIDVHIIYIFSILPHREAANGFETENAPFTEVERTLDDWWQAKTAQPQDLLLTLLTKTLEHQEQYPRPWPTSPRRRTLHPTGQQYLQSTTYLPPQKLVCGISHRGGG